MNTHKSLIYMKHWIPDISLFTLKSDYLMKVWGNNRFAWHGINWFIFILLSCISGYLCIVVSCFFLFFLFLHGRYLDINKQYTALKNVLTKYVNTLYCHQPFRLDHDATTLIWKAKDKMRQQYKEIIIVCLQSFNLNISRNLLFSFV